MHPIQEIDAVGCSFPKLFLTKSWEKTKGGNRRAPSKIVMLKWIKQAWDAISPDIVRKSFKKCGNCPGKQV
jgi:hypothetical protein